MWENTVIAIIVVACVFFIGRKAYRQFKGRDTGCGCGCTGCDPESPAETNSGGNSRHKLPVHENGCNCPTKIRK